MIHAYALRNSYVLICLLSMIVVNNAAAFWVIPDAPIHQFVTGDALLDDSVSAQLSDGTKVRFSVDAVREIMDANKQVDDIQGYPPLHFDNESFRNGSLILKDAIDVIVYNLTQKINPDGRAAWKHLGEALHTLQDFYSHSTWIEKYGAGKINDDLGKNLIDNDFETVRTCESNGATIISTNGVLPFTSGYYDGYSQFTSALVNGVEKCVHGNLVLSNLPLSGYGIHKDGPTRFKHQEARELATKASIDYVMNKLLPKLYEISDARKRDDAICALMGVSPSTSASCGISMYSVGPASTPVKIASKRTTRNGDGSIQVDYFYSVRVLLMFKNNFIMCLRGEEWIPHTGTARSESQMINEEPSGLRTEHYSKGHATYNLTKNGVLTITNLFEQTRNSSRSTSCEVYKSNGKSSHRESYLLNLGNGTGNYSINNSNNDSTNYTNSCVLDRNFNDISGWNNSGGGSWPKGLANPLLSYPGLTFRFIKRVYGEMPEECTEPDNECYFNNEPCGS